MMKKITFLLICLLTITIASAQLTSVALVGSGTEQGWPADPQTDTHQMTSNDSENWTITNINLLNGAIKFRGNNSWDLPYNWGGTDFPSGTATIDGPGINVTRGIYNVSFNSTSRVYSFQFVSHINISIIGDATPGGWGTDTDMSTTDGINYNLEGITLIAGNLKFRGNHSWTLPYNWGGSDFPSGTAIVDGEALAIPSNGIYNISFNIDTAIYSFSLTYDTIWTGDLNSEWVNVGNWSNGVPTIGQDVLITDVANAPIIGSSTNVNLGDLIISEVDGLSIASGGSLIVNGISTGNVTFNRNLGTSNWYLVSSPVSGQVYNDAYGTANGIASGTGNNRGIASYTTSENTWSYLQSGGSGTFNNCQGYSVKRSASGDISFTGTINTSDVSVAVSNASNGFNLIGNPFTSHINSATFLGDNSANLVSETLWVWNQGTSSYETKVTGDAFILAPAQGFFVRSSSGTDLNIAESYQAVTGGTFQKSSRTEVKLMMNDGTVDRFAKMYFLENVTKGFDNGFDGEIFGGIENSVDIFTNLLADNKGKKLQVQSLPISEMETMVIPLGIKASAGKEITFTAEVMYLPKDVKVLLEDRLANTITRLDEANSSYGVTLKDAVNGTGRFYLHTKVSGVLSTGDTILESISIYTPNKSTLRVVGLSKGKATVKLFNILGEQVMQTPFSLTGVQNISLPKLATGMYIVQLETAYGKLNKKIVLE